MILALPSDERFEGGELHVWDGKPKQELAYRMAPGGDSMGIALIRCFMITTCVVVHQIMKMNENEK